MISRLFHILGIMLLLSVQGMAEVAEVAEEKHSAKTEIAIHSHGALSGGVHRLRYSHKFFSYGVRECVSASAEALSLPPMSAHSPAIHTGRYLLFRSLLI